VREGVVYMLTNRDTGKRFIGKSWNLDQRIYKHRREQTVDTDEPRVTILRHSIKTQTDLDKWEAHYTRKFAERTASVGEDR
jgi:predicted GIY-YIG superfamily endonuclease